MQPAQMRAMPSAHSFLGLHSAPGSAVWPKFLYGPEVHQHALRLALQVLGLDHVDAGRRQHLKGMGGKGERRVLRQAEGAVLCKPEIVPEIRSGRSLVLRKRVAYRAAARSFLSNPRTQRVVPLPRRAVQVHAQRRDPASTAVWHRLRHDETDDAQHNLAC
jgi:hypothetical protein